MKKLTLSFLVLCFTLVAMAEPIGKQSALYTAQSYMMAKGKQVKAMPVSTRARANANQSANDWDDAFYVFNADNNGGYVIVSGDDRVEPILGYVEQGSFDPENIPVNMRTMLQMYADEIHYIVRNDIQPGDPRIKMRNKVAGTRHSVGELLTTRWNQGKPYNITCPQYYKEEESSLTLSSYPATGCTATAMAQVINFYKYPEKTTKTIPSFSNTYWSKDGNMSQTMTRPSIPRGTVIDWENMRDTYSWDDGHVSNAQDTAVANLMRLCGFAVKMGYGPSSGANFDQNAFIEYFGFDSRAYRAYRSDCSIDEWFNLLYRDISAGFPVCYAGFSSGGGHAFVIDGFDGENLFHVNWGWGGGSNGWFLISILNPGDNSGIGASSSSDGYSMGCYALFNLRIPNSPKEDLSLAVSDVSITGNVIKATFKNKTLESNSFNVGIVMLNDEGECELVGAKSTASLAGGKQITKNFSMSGKLPEGTYRLSPASKLAKGDIWYPCYDFEKQYIEAVVDSTGTMLSFHEFVPNVESISIDTIVFPGTLVQNESQEVKVTFRNNGKEYFREIHMFASQTDDEPKSENYTKSRSMVAVRSGETVDVSYFFKPEATGTYKLWFCTSSNGSGLVGETTMDIFETAQIPTANLTVSSYSITNIASGSTFYGPTLVGKANIKNNKTNEDFHGKIRLQVWNQPNGSGSAWSGSSKTFEVDIMAGKIATVEFEFNDMKENNKYYISASHVDHTGTFGNSGVWDLGGWTCGMGIAIWKADGSPTGKAFNSTITSQSTWCGVLADCSRKINRMSKNSRNPNTIFVFTQKMELPIGLETANLVHGNHADHINLYNDYAYYLPATFNADSASFTYTFPETEDGTKWHSFTMPFEAESITLDSIPVALDDTLNHFWIYEFSAEKLNGDIIFKPATKLHSGVPYIIAADKKMAGRSLVFSGMNVPFFKSGSNPMVVTSKNYKFHGNTYSPKLKNCYVMNDDGTAFEYTTTTKTLDPMAAYFTTNLPDTLAPASIVLPDIPTPPIKEITLDEMAENTIEADTYDILTLKSTFSAGMNTICLPFKVEEVEAIFGQGAQAYEFYSFRDNELNFVKVDTLAASQPYIIVLPADFSEDIVLNDIAIDEFTTEAHSVEKTGACLCGTYSRILQGTFESDIYGLTAEGMIVKLEEDLTDTVPVLVKGFHAYFELDTENEVMVCLYDDATGIKNVNVNLNENIYNLAGQRVNKIQNGIFIKNGKKILK